MPQRTDCQTERDKCQQTEIGGDMMLVDQSGEEIREGDAPVRIDSGDPAGPLEESEYGKQGGVGADHGQDQEHRRAALNARPERTDGQPAGAPHEQNPPWVARQRGVHAGGQPCDMFAPYQPPDGPLLPVVKRWIQRLHHDKSHQPEPRPKDRKRSQARPGAFSRTILTVRRN